MLYLSVFSIVKIVFSNKFFNILIFSIKQRSYYTKILDSRYSEIKSQMFLPTYYLHIGMYTKITIMNKTHTAILL